MLTLEFHKRILNPFLVYNGIFVSFCKTVKNFYVDSFDYSIHVCLMKFMILILKSLVLFNVINSPVIHCESC